MATRTQDPQLLHPYANILAHPYPFCLPGERAGDAIGLAVKNALTLHNGIGSMGHATKLKGQTDTTPSVSCTATRMAVEQRFDIS
jgi:hypothetical protein